MYKDPIVMVVNEDNNEPRHCLHRSGYLSLEDIRKKKVKLLNEMYYPASRQSIM